MAIKARPYAVGHRDFLGKAIGDPVAVADGSTSLVLGITGLWRLTATSDCKVDLGPNPDASAKGESWPTGQVEVRYLEATDKISVAAGL